MKYNILIKSLVLVILVIFLMMCVLFLFSKIVSKVDTSQIEYDDTNKISKTDSTYVVATDYNVNIKSITTFNEFGRRTIEVINFKKDWWYIKENGEMEEPIQWNGEYMQIHSGTWAFVADLRDCRLATLDDLYVELGGTKVWFVRDKHDSIDMMIYCNDAEAYYEIMSLEVYAPISTEDCNKIAADIALNCKAPIISNAQWNSIIKI